MLFGDLPGVSDDIWDSTPTLEIPRSASYTFIPALARLDSSIPAHPKHDVTAVTTWEDDPSSAGDPGDADELPPDELPGSELDVAPKSVEEKIEPFTAEVLPPERDSPSLSPGKTRARPSLLKASSVISAKMADFGRGTRSWALTSPMRPFQPFRIKSPLNLSVDVAARGPEPASSSSVVPRTLPATVSNLEGPETARGGSRTKDELWSVFRELDSDFHRFQSKTSALKVNLVRSSVIPFLRDYADHPSNYHLRPEDLDRRTTILNKWWTALLEMVDGRSSYMLSGTDRPVVFDAISGIMTRSEWRSASSTSAPSSQQATSRAPSRVSHSTISLDSTGSDFVNESIHHNVRNLFSQNLILQASIVINKLSLRSAPASLINFAGKALAYAFYFSPGIAEILVRLWALTSTNIRSVAEAFDLDLFFVFVRQWHLLLEDFLPPEATVSEKAGAPAFALVYAQLMAVLQSTLHRSSGGLPAAANSMGTSAITFDDVLGNANGAGPDLPFLGGNSTRMMAENRLITLLREVLSDKCSDDVRAVRTLATFFAKILQTAARRTSKFNQDACYALCDFLEEVIYVFARYQATNSSVPDLIDWPFWFAVCQQMADSRNTLSEIRLFAFLYSIWGLVVADDRRKEAVCLGWLLTRRIVASLMSNLRRAWTQILVMSNAARTQCLLPPLTKPCYPAPGRRIVIVRDDQPLTPTPYLSFDGLTSSLRLGPTIMSRRASFLSSSIQDECSGDSVNNTPHMDGGAKKRWSILRNIRKFGNPTDDDFIPDRAHAPTYGSQVRSEAEALRQRSSDPPSSQSSGTLSGRMAERKRVERSMSDSSGTSAEPIRPSFKFALEWLEKESPLLRDNRFHAPRLPQPAQDLLSAEEDDDELDGACRPLESIDAEGRRYAGRALSEWALVVHEFQHFATRRKAEGVLSDDLVETPTLGVDWFRKLG
ncbi:MAG: hypothetical protein M1826_004827 [Phylliscum demangeonii]|nr:MAG: hypothetical protein M1826_004827 [Phylliscum demangeonii]